MDIVSGVSREQIHLYIWVATAVFAVAGGILQPSRIHWTALGTVIGFAALNAGAGIYVLNHYADTRWASPGASRLNAPSLAETPLVGQFMGPLDSALNSVVSGVNEFLAFRDALPVALEFMVIAGWALLVSFPVAVLVFIVNFILARRRAAIFSKYKVKVDVLGAEVEELRRQLEAMSGLREAVPQNTAVYAVDNDTNTPISLRPIG